MPPSTTRAPTAAKNASAVVDPLGCVPVCELGGVAGDDLVGAVDLFDGEHGVGTGEQAATGPAALVVVVGVALGGGRLPQDDLGALLAAADLGAVALPAAVGGPHAAGPAVGGGDHGRATGRSVPR